MDIEKRNTLKLVKVPMDKLARRSSVPGNALYHVDGSYSVLGMVCKAAGIGRLTLAKKGHGGDPWKSNYISRVLLAVAPGLTPERCAALTRINDSDKSDNDFKQAVRVVMNRAGIRVVFTAEDKATDYPRSKSAQRYRATNLPTPNIPAPDWASDITDEDDDSEPDVGPDSDDLDDWAV